MAGTTAGWEKAPAGTEAEAGAVSSSARAAPQAPALFDRASGAAGAAEPSVERSGGGGEEEEEVDDEQVERFYALLANIRAMRGVYGDGFGGGTGTDGGETEDGGGPRKRARRAEPPWRPAFRLEDFEVPPSPATDNAPCAQSSWKPRNEADDAASTPAVASPPPPPPPPAKRAAAPRDGSNKV
ncbi:hypothetical protein ACP70R_035262 [Stipagrostis hirtigluma subsp. patula]